MNTKEIYFVIDTANPDLPFRYTYEKLNTARRSMNLQNFYRKENGLSETYEVWSITISLDMLKKCER